MYERAEASIPLRIVERRRELDVALHDFPPDIKAEVINKLILIYRDDLHRKLRARCREGSPDEAKNFNIQKKVSMLLEGLRENGYFSDAEKASVTRGRYMAAVFEEYARAPYVERERIYFSETCAVIENAIDQERALIITYAQSELPSFVLPYSLETDKLSMYNYLIGYAHPVKPLNDALLDVPLHIDSFRLPKILRLEIDRWGKHGSGKLNPCQLERIKKARAKFGTMFIADEDKATEVVVRLSQNGQIEYRNQVHMRPSRLEDRDKKFDKEGAGNNSYIFECTERQAEHYFFKFGSDAVVMSPPGLREKFRNKYYNAFTEYDNCSK
jgi:hypothetical protein